MNTATPVKAPCLPAQLLMLLLRELGQSVSADSLQAACDQSASQPPEQAMRHILEQLNLTDIKAELMPWQRFNQRRLPVLVLLDGQWLLAQVDEQTGRLALYSAQGKVIDSPGTMLGAKALWLYKRRSIVDRLPAKVLQRPSARLIRQEMFSGHRWLVDILIATLVINVLAVATSLFAMQVYDRVVPTFAYATLTALVAGMLIILALDLFLKLTRSHILDKMASRVDQRVSQRLYESLLNLRQDTRPTHVGSMAAQVNGLDAVRNFLSSTVIFTLMDLPFALFFVFVISVIGGPIGFIYLTLLLLSILIGGLTRWRLSSLSATELQLGNERHGLLVDTIQGSESIRLTSSVSFFAQQWREFTYHISHYVRQSKFITSASTAIAGTVGSLAYLLAIATGVSLIEEGSLSMGGLIACVILGGRIIAPATQAVQLISQWQVVKESLGMVDQLLLQDAHRANDAEALRPLALEPQVELEGVQFSYPESAVLQANVPGLTFRSGERIVLLGGVGSGKTTLLKMLAGLYKPSQGRVKLGGVDIWEIDAAVLAEHIAYMPQDIHLFKGSLRENLMLAGGTDDELIRTVRTLGIDVIAQGRPKGLDSPITEGGRGLSGGQRQLIGLGRLFLARPKIWLLDEPTASLDQETEARVLKALNEQVQADDIVIMATHKLALAKAATRVIVMRAGQVIADEPPHKILSVRPHQKEGTNGQ